MITIQHAIKKSTNFSNHSNARCVTAHSANKCIPTRSQEHAEHPYAHLKFAPRKRVGHQMYKALCNWKYQWVTAATETLRLSGNENAVLEAMAILSNEEGVGNPSALKVLGFMKKKRGVTLHYQTTQKIMARLAQKGAVKRLNIISLYKHTNVYKLNGFEPLELSQFHDDDDEEAYNPSSLKDLKDDLKHHDKCVTRTVFLRRPKLIYVPSKQSEQKEASKKKRDDRFKPGDLLFNEESASQIPIEGDVIRHINDGYLTDEQRREAKLHVKRQKCPLRAKREVVYRLLAFAKKKRGYGLFSVPALMTKFLKEVVLEQPQELRDLWASATPEDIINAHISKEQRQYGQH